MDKITAGNIILFLILLIFLMFAGAIMFSIAADPASAQQINISQNDSGDDLPDSVVKELADGVVIRDVIEEEERFKVVIEVQREESVTLTKAWLIESPWITEEDRISLSKGNHTVIMEKKPESEGMAIVNMETNKYEELQGGGYEFYNEDTNPLHSWGAGTLSVSVGLAIFIGMWYRKQLKIEKRIL